MAKRRQTDVNINYNVNTAKIEKSNQLLAQSSKLTDDFRKNVDKTGQSIEKAGEQGAKTFTNWKNILSSISVTALAYSLQQLAKRVFDLGVVQEQTNIAFTTFLGSAEKAKKLLAELQQFAKVTPFTSTQVNQAARTLLGFNFAAEDIIPTLRMLGDVSAGTGKDLGEMTVIFGQIRAAGQLYGQDLLQLINAGFNPLQQIAKTTGKSVRELKKDMENGLVTYDMVKQAFIEVTQEGGLFFNLLENQSKSTGGRMSVIEDNLEMIQKRLFELNKGGLSETITLAGEATTEVDAIAQSLDAIISHFTFGPRLALKFFVSIADKAKEAARETERLRLAQLQFELSVAKTDLQSPTTDAKRRVELIKEIIRLSKELGQLPKGTTEDPLPWATEDKKVEVEGIIEALRKKIKSLNDEIARTTDKGDLGITGKLIVELKKAQDELDRLLGKETDSDKDGEKRRKEALENTRKYLKSMYEKRKNDADADAKRQRENDKRSFEHWKYYQGLKVQKQQETEEEQFRIMEDNAARRRQLEEEIFRGAEMLATSLLSLAFTQRDIDIDGLREYYDEQIKLAGDNDRLKAELQIKRERELNTARDRQHELDKKNAQNKIFVDGLVAIAKIFAEYGWPGGIIPAAIMAGITAVNAATVGKYAEGVIDLKGPGTKTSDSIPARLSRGESVMTADETSTSKGILKSIRARKLNDRLLSEIVSGRSGGASTKIFDDSKIVSKLEEIKNATPDLELRNNMLYEAKKSGESYWMWIRRKSMNA